MSTLGEFVVVTGSQVPPSKMGAESIDILSLPAYDDSRVPERRLPSTVGSGKAKIDVPCVLVSKLNPRIPRIWLVERPHDRTYCSPEFLQISPQGAQLDLRYLYFLLWSKATVLATGVKGTTGSHQRIAKEDVLQLEVEIPLIEEQREIAAILGALDDKIESNQRAMETALALARAHVDRAVAGHGAAAYSTVLDVRMGAAFKGTGFSEPGVGRPLLRIRDLKTFESQVWTAEERKDETVIRPGDVVVGMDAEFRAVLWFGEESVLNQRVCSFRGKESVGRAFVLAALEPELSFQEQAKTGTTVIHLNKADIETFVVPALSTEEHRSLSSITEPLVDLAVAKASETRTLARVRDALLPELLSGRIRVAPEAAA